MNPEPLNRETRTVKLRFTVRDTGIGIPEVKLNQLFNKFSQVDASITRRFGGTGLGLAISRQLVEMMGGRIGVHSVDGQGSTFWFTVCLDLAHQGEMECLGKFLQSAPGESLHFGHTNARILVAEDNPVNQQVALGMLKKFGLHADTVTNGREALNALHTNRYDLVLMDVMMPEMDGLAATREIRKKEEERMKEEGNAADSSDLPPSAFSLQPSHRHLPVIAMTAGARSEDREHCLEAGMDDFVSKPVSPDELARVLGRWLSEGGERKADGRFQRSKVRGQGAEVRGQESEVGSQKSGGRREEGGVRSQESGGRSQEGEECEAKEGVRQTGDEEALPLFDRVGFLDRCMGDEELAREVIALFLDNLPQRIQELQAALDAGDAPAASMAAHTIKGMAANTCAEALRKVAGEMEDAARDGDLEAVRVKMDTLLERFEKLRKVLV